jgi:cytochrome b involved in lipid metabolism
MNRMPEGANWTHYLAHCIQDAEMLSLFILFVHFYAKAYKQRRFETAQTVAELSASVADSDSDSDTAADQASISSDSSVEDRDDAAKLRQRKTVDNDRATVMTQTERIASLSSLKGNEVCIDGIIYNLDNFEHPGGDSIQIFGGNDVTIQYKMIHPYHTDKHLEKMKRVGKVADFVSE